MVVLVVKDLVANASDNQSGTALFEQIQHAFQQGQTVTVSFEAVPYVSTSFVNSAFINLLATYSFDEIRKQLRFTQSTVQINALIKDRFAFETQKRSTVA